MSALGALWAFSGIRRILHQLLNMIRIRDWKMVPEESRKAARMQR
jgi:hypothetical protein